MTSFDELVAGARGGDQEALSNLYLNHVSMVYGYLRACRAVDPEDLTSEVFLGMLRNLDRFDGGHPEFRRWLMTIAHRRLVDQRRRDYRNRIDLASSDSLDELSTAQVPEAPVSNLDPELIAAFEDLTCTQREVLALRFVADVSLQGVSVIIGRPVGAVKALQNRGLRSLRKRVAHLRDRLEV
jgi:RNA polymerase sigma-70 factor (ECF subfamily)